MGFSPEEIEFTQVMSGAVAVAEDEMKVSLTDDTDHIFLRMLFNEYVAEGRPKKRKAWFRAKLPPYFQCVDKMPVWVEDQAVWPFLNGRPMTFVTQHTLPNNRTVEERLCLEETLYIFGAKVEVPRGWRMEYKVVTQLPSLKGLRLVIEDVSAIDELNRLAEG